MRKGLFFILGIYAASFLLTTGCINKETPISDSIQVDSIWADSVENDTLSEMIEETPMPIAADELFDDFFFNFAASGRVQKERIIFPLIVDNFGKKKSMEKKEWRREHFFMNQGYYTLVFHSMKEQAMMKDTAVSDVTVEKISFTNQRITRWHFARKRGLWYMDEITNGPIKQHPEAAFLEFYNNFVTDSVFQQESLSESIQFTGPDPDDDFSTMTGEIFPEQLKIFVPWMPSGTLYNIKYGAGEYKPSDVRFFLICGIGNGLRTDLIFTRKGKSWQLKKINT